jgi:hypothetical protein
MLPWQQLSSRDTSLYPAHRYNPSTFPAILNHPLATLFHTSPAADRSTLYKEDIQLTSDARFHNIDGL